MPRRSAASLPLLLECSRPLATTLTRRAGTRQVLHVQRLLHDDARQVHGARHEHPLLRRRVRPDQALARAARSKRPRPRGRPPLPEARPLAWGCALDTRPPGTRLLRRSGACPRLRRRRLWRCRWADFRGSVLGPTDPKDAPEGALRGIIAGDWEKLGLKAPCNGGDNAVHASASPDPNPKPKPNPKPGLSLNLNPTYPNPNPTSPSPDPKPDQVHASASPFEGLAERTNWLGVAIADDSFGKALLAAGVPEETIKKWSSDPQVTYDAETAKSTGRAARPKRPRCAAPQLAPRASSGRARRLRAAQHSQGEAAPPGAQPRPRLLKPTATEAADSTAFWSTQARRKAPSSTPSRTSTTRSASTSASPSARPS